MGRGCGCGRRAPAQPRRCRGRRRRAGRRGGARGRRASLRRTRVPLRRRAGVDRTPTALAATVGRADASLGARTVRRTRPPTGVRVPALGLDATVRPVGVGGERQMRLPADPRVLGWYRFGPGPGDQGSVVLAGHVDSRRFGVGPLADLPAIGVGDRIEIATGPAGPGSTGSTASRGSTGRRCPRTCSPAPVPSGSGS